MQIQVALKLFQYVEKHFWDIFKRLLEECKKQAKCRYGPYIQYLTTPMLFWPHKM